MELILFTEDDYQMCHPTKTDMVICLGSLAFALRCKLRARPSIWCHVRIKQQGQLIDDDLIKLFDAFSKYVIEARTLIHKEQVKRGFIVHDKAQRKAAGVGLALSCLFDVMPLPSSWLLKYPTLCTQTAMAVIIQWQKVIANSMNEMKE